MGSILFWTCNVRFSSNTEYNYFIIACAAPDTDLSDGSRR